MTRTFNFPVWLKGTEEEQNAEAERQALALAAHGRGHLTEAERLVGRGVLLEKTARENLKAAKHRNKAARILAQDQIADALAMQGRFREAAQTHTERYRRKYFREVGKAIEKPDEEKCKCSDRKAEMNGTELAITPRFERAKVFSPLHNDLVSLVECSKCGHMNARPPRSRLLPQQAALQSNEVVANSAGRNALISDVQILGINQ